MNNTCLRCLTASAGTIIRRDYSLIFVILFLRFRPLQHMLSSVFDVASSGFRPLTKILDCCLPLKSGPFSLPVRLYCLSTQLSINGLVCLYHTNYQSERLSLFSWISNILFLIPGFSSFFKALSFPNALYVQSLSTPVHQDTSSRSLLICNVLNASIVFTLSQNQTLILFGAFICLSLSFHIDSFVFPLSFPSYLVISTYFSFFYHCFQSFNSIPSGILTSFPPTFRSTTLNPVM